MSNETLFLVLIFLSTFLMVLGLFEFSSRPSRRRLQERLREVAAETQGKKHLSLVRERYLRERSPWERRIMDLPGIDALVAGHTHQTFPSATFPASTSVDPQRGSSCRGHRDAGPWRGGGVAAVTYQAAKRRR